MDFLERSADAAIATEDTTAQKRSGNNQTDKARNKLPYSLRPRGLLDLAHPATPRTASKLPSNSDCEDAQEEGVGDGTGGAANDRPSVSLPSLPAAGTGLLSQGRWSGSAVNNSNFWAPSSSLSNNAPTEGGADTLTCHPAYVPQAPLGKPILKPPSQDATASSDTRCNDPFSPRSVPLDSSHPEQNILVRGTTLFPFSPSNRWSSDASVPRRTHSSKGTADLRRRAVRFSISDQVREFTPSEPLLP
ncbi:hypothetical protein BaRGS_00028577 [Batillaria attramentaria]|uniref:Uncharacterized protein n=1 Tax=Batillaria attramentaria TaxID=370345 RepID=A0ABD0JZ40_9CAEN